VLHHAVDHLAWLDDHHPEVTEPARHHDPVMWAAITTAGRSSGERRDGANPKGLP
jgi:hypothetical protein